MNIEKVEKTIRKTFLLHSQNSKKYRCPSVQRIRSEKVLIENSEKKIIQRQKNIYYIEKGNNSEIIRKCFKQREEDWEDALSNFSRVNFKWTQTSMSINYTILTNNDFCKQCVNHMEFHREISNKYYLLKNLQEYYYSRNNYAFTTIPLTFTIDLDSENYRKDLTKFLDFYSNQETELNYTNEKYKKIAFKDIQEFKKKQDFFQGKNLWLLKPAGRNRGIGILIFDDIQKFNNYIQTLAKKQFFQPTKKPEWIKTELAYKKIEDITMNIKFITKTNISKKFVIQKYLENPLLINKRKFDIRVWALLDQNKNLYWFREGYLRTSSELYKLDDDEDIDNYFIHLTNNAIQKNSDKYQQFEAGNQISFKEFQKYLDGKKELSHINFKNMIVPKIKNFIRITFEAVKEKLDRNFRANCFEIFGFDFMIDNSYNLWLIEANTNPCLEESSPLLKILIPRMIDDAFRLTIDKVFAKTVYSPNSIFKIDGYKDNFNIWEFLTSIKIER